MANVKAIPEGYHAVTPYLICDGAAEAMAFYRKAFGATDAYPPVLAPGGKVRHAEMRIGDSLVMLADEVPEMGFRGPRAHGGTPVSLHLYVADVDATFRAAVDAGAKIVREVENQFYGDRSGIIEDPCGHVWSISTHVEDVSPEELERRMKAQAG